MVDKSTKEFTPDVLADVLLAEYVLKEEENRRFEFDPQWKEVGNFSDMVKLYKIALVLTGLLNVERENKDYLHVRICFEKLVFRYGNVEKLGFYYNVKYAMDKLGELLDVRDEKFYNLEVQNKNIPWTMNCLPNAGVLKNDQHIVQDGGPVVWMGWAMAWLKDVGIIELNPVRLMEFAVMWIDNYIAINGFLKDIHPKIS
jgi:hypothetical protein